MFDNLRTNWRLLINTQPGMRFKERYFRLKQQPDRRSSFIRFLHILSGLVIIFIGIVFWFIPGPGWAMIFIGAAILARESLIIARILDWLEVLLRNIYNKVKDHRQKKTTSSG